MKVIIFFYAIATCRCDLEQLREPDTHYVLIATEDILLRWELNDKDFFDEVIDVEAMTVPIVKPWVAQLIERFGHASVHLTCSDDMTVTVVAALRELFNLSGVRPAAIARFSDKIVMKEFLQTTAIRIPKFLPFIRQEYLADPAALLNKVINKLGFPMIAKPTNLVGSAGVSTLLDLDALEEWAEQALESELTFELNEFIAGKLFHCDAIIKDGKILHTDIAEYSWPCHLFSAGNALGSMRLALADSRREPLEVFHREILLTMQPPDGATHLEIFEKPDGELVFLEIAARPAGAMVIVHYELDSKVNFELAHFCAQLGLPVTMQPEEGVEYHTWAFVPKMPGTIKALTLPDFSSQVTMEWQVVVGETIPPRHLKEGEMIFCPSEVAGTIFLKNADYHALRQDFELLRQEKLITYEK